MKKNVKIVESLEIFSLLPEGTSTIIQNEAEEQRGGILSLILGMLGASLSGNILAGKGINRAGEGIVRAAYGNKKRSKKEQQKDNIMKIEWIFLCRLILFEIQTCYQNEPRFNDDDLIMMLLILILLE